MPLCGLKKLSEEEAKNCIGNKKELTMHLLVLNFEDNSELWI